MHIRVVDLGGTEHRLDGTAGQSLMQTIRDGGIDDLQAICGGSRSCATCHFYVAEGFMPLLPPMGEDENDLLDSSLHRREGSRLSCQITLGNAMDGIVVTVAPPD